MVTGLGIVVPVFVRGVLVISEIIVIFEGRYFPFLIFLRLTQDPKNIYEF